MRKSRGGPILLIIFLLGMGMVGCRSALIPKVTINPIPVDMPLEAVRLLIALSIDRSARPNWDAPSTKSQRVLTELFAGDQTITRWSIEAIEANTIRAGFSARGGEHYSQYYVSVHIHFTEAKWWITIIDGRNLGFDGERIHKNALLWVNGLEQDIRQSFTTYQTMLGLNQ